MRKPVRRAGSGKKAFPLVRFLNILIVAAAVAAGFCLMLLVREIRDAFDRETYSSLEYWLQQGEYADMVSEYYRRYYDIAPFESEYGEWYHLAEYADAAFRARLFEAAGDGEQAARCAGRAESARGGCGSLSVAIEDIDMVLERIPSGH